MNKNLTYFFLTLITLLLILSCTSTNITREFFYRTSYQNQIDSILYLGFFDNFHSHSKGLMRNSEKLYEKNNISFEYERFKKSDQVFEISSDSLITLSREKGYNYFLYINEIKSDKTYSSYYDGTNFNFSSSTDYTFELKVYSVKDSTHFYTSNLVFEGASSFSIISFEGRKTAKSIFKRLEEKKLFKN